MANDRLSTVWRSRVELTAWPTSPNALSSPTDRASSRSVHPFLKQPHVLDGDHRLVREGFKQFDLLVGEWADLRAADDESHRWVALAQQRRGKNGPDAGDLLKLARDPGNSVSISAARS